MIDFSFSFLKPLSKNASKGIYDDICDSFKWYIATAQECGLYYVIGLVTSFELLRLYM